MGWEKIAELAAQGIGALTRVIISASKGEDPKPHLDEARGILDRADGLLAKHDADVAKRLGRG